MAFVGRGLYLFGPFPDVMFAYWASMVTALNRRLQGTDVSDRIWIMAESRQWNGLIDYFLCS